MKTVALFFGGKSTEHDISILTGLAAIAGPLKASGKYKIEPVYIAKNGAFYWDSSLLDISLYTSGKIEEELAKMHPIAIQFDGGMTLVKSTGLTGRKKSVKIDVAFTGMHGTYGEDGSLMGLLRMAGVPFIGSDMEASVLSMNKVTSKIMVKEQGVPVVKSVHFKKAEYSRHADKIIARINSELTYPLFVKPAHLGSSIGISQVTEQKELTNALEVAMHYDQLVLVEEAVQNLIEVTLPILGSPEHPELALVERPLRGDGMLDFEAKYIGDGSKKGAKSKGINTFSEIPAKLPEDLYKKCEEVARNSYQALGCDGISRIDMLINGKTNEVFFNEVNPLPGDLYAHNWRTAGVSPVDLVDKLVNRAIKRSEEESQQATSFTTNYLKQF